MPISKNSSGVYRPKFQKKTHFWLVNTYRLEMISVLEIIQTLQTLRYNGRRKITSSNCNIFATSPLSRSASIRAHVEVPNG